ncbi:MAG: hypothetical protein QX198_12265 [Methylococcaceae bacterium]
MGTTDQVSHFGHESVDKTASRTGGQLNKTGDKLKCAWRQFVKTCRSYIIAKPLRSMLIAATLGFLLSGMWMEIVFAAVLFLVKNGADASSAILFSIAFNMLLATLLWGFISNEKT